MNDAVTRVVYEVSFEGLPVISSHGDFVTVISPQSEG